MKIDYSTKVTDIEGTETDLEKFRGKVLLVVNTASRCGYTRQYRSLETLYRRWHAHGFSVLGFPCNQFGNQEPGTESQIKEFCMAKFGVDFDLFSKVNVNGEQAHGFYKHLTTQTTKPKGAGKVSWNFEKFLIDRSGKVIARFDGGVKPNDPAVIKLIEQQLAQ